MAARKPNDHSSHGDRGLIAHRVTQYFITGMVTILTTVVGYNYETWSQMQQQVFSMKDVPADIKQIRDALSDIRESMAAQVQNNDRVRGDITELKSAVSK